ncbi:MAG: hypothetical protein ACYTGR_02660 [Planctomycetota bacterium]|jgi:outer membrane protein assembly factor BamE (lipoprotein component of BamABCDE complex)
MKQERRAFGKTLVLAVLAAALLVLGALLILKSPNRVTEFAPDYTHAAFARIHVGVSADRVLELIGEPLTTSTHETAESWHYSLPEVAESHMSVRCVVIDSRTRTVVRVEQRARFDYLTQVLPGGSDHAYGE